MNYLSHLVGRTMQLNQSLEPARGNPFEPAQAREPAVADSELPEQQFTQRLRPVRMDAPAPAVVVDQPREEFSPTPTPLPSAAARLDAVLAQAPVPREVLPDSGPLMQPAPQRPSSEPAPHVEPVTARDAQAQVTRLDEARTPAARWAEASRDLRRPMTRTPLPPASAEPSVVAPQRFSAPASRSAPRAKTRARLAPERAINAAHVAGPDASAMPSIDAAMPAAPSPVRRASPLLPMVRAMPPPAAAAASTAATPDVHISIGSVEIRAQSAPARARPAVNSPRALRPSMSLGDYLQKRRGGR